MLYGQEGGGGMNPMMGSGALAGMIARRRRRPGLMGRGGPGHVGGPGGLIDPNDPNVGGPGGLGGGPIDPGFNMDPQQPYPMPNMQADPTDPTMGHVTWGPNHRTFTNPNKLWGWEQKHGNQMGKKEFWRLHPDAARRLGMPIQGDQQEMDPMDPNHLKAGLIGQLVQAHGALQGGQIPGIHKMAHNRMHAVGAAQARAHALAQIMARRLRGRGGGGRPTMGMGAQQGYQPE